jgi:hypothetical protein
LRSYPAAISLISGHAPVSEGMAAMAADEAGQKSGTDLTGSFARVVGVVHSFPYAVILTAGIFAVLAAFVRKVGSWELVTQGSQFLVLAVGAVLMAIGLAGPLVESRRMSRSLAGYRLDGKPLPPEAMDVEFMFQVFYLCMPPAFVKRFGPMRPDGTREAVDIVYSREFDRFQRSGLTAEVSDDLRHRTIMADHVRGDQEALARGYSLLVEFPTSTVDGRLSPILTCKTAFAYKDRTYVAGWYLPIDLPPERRAADAVTIRDEVGQPVLRPALVGEGQGIRVPVGAAVRADALAAASRTMPYDGPLPLPRRTP